MTRIEKIAIIGAGAMGGIYASKFYDMNPDSVVLVADGHRYERLRTNGLVVNQKIYPIPVVRPDQETPPSDLVLIAVKHHHLPAAIEQIRNRVGKDTMILSVMNGIDSEAQIGAVYGMERVVYAMAAGIDAVREGDAITYSTSGKIVFGEKDNESLSQRVRAIQSLLDAAGIAHNTPRDMVRMLWWKFMVNVGMNQVSAVLRGPYGIFNRSVHAKGLMVGAMKEVVTLAKAVGVNLTERDIDEWFPVMATMSAEGKTSMLQDVEARRKTEVEMFAGRVIALGRSHGIPTPINDTLFQLIRAIEECY